MIRTLILDDEPLALKLLSVYIQKIPDMELAGACSNADEAEDRLAQGDIDCLFTDINMPGTSGMELVRKLENPPLVIFTTAYSDYAVEGFRVNAIDYLVKPFRFEEFQEAVSKVRRMMEMKSLAQGSDKDERVLFFKVGHQKIRMLSSDIIYVESLGAYMKIHPAGMDPFIVLSNFKGILEAAPEHLIRIHKSYAVNSERIARYGKTGITLQDGTALPVGEAYASALEEKMSANG